MQWMNHIMKLGLSRLILIISILLMSINIFGLFQDLRPEGLVPEVLRFKENDLLLSIDEFKQGVLRLENESEEDYAERLTHVIADGMAHIHWQRYSPDEYHQRVPIWENYILFAMGHLTNIPEYRRYHFSDPMKSIERGIGLCGDASILMSQLLDSNGIDNQIVSMPGHVIVEASLPSGKRIFDPDFGVSLSSEAKYYESRPSELVAYYEKEGFFNNGELLIARNLAKYGPEYWNGVSHFITKKYYFEKMSYSLKWIIPLLLFFCFWFANKRK